MSDTLKQSIESVLKIFSGMDDAQKIYATGFLEGLAITADNQELSAQLRESTRPST